MSFPRLTTPRGRKEETASLKQLWDSCKADKKKLDSLLEVSGEEAMEDLRAVAPAMEALVDLTADFAERYRVEKLRLNSLDFSDQEHLALRLLVKEDGRAHGAGRAGVGPVSGDFGGRVSGHQ